MTENSSSHSPAAPRHHWHSSSSHSTSEGRVHYQRCACGAHRVIRHGSALASIEVDSVRRMH
jgi:hypothetical protein